MLTIDPVPTDGEALLDATESVCPECLRRVPARHVRCGDDVYLRKACPDHGEASTVTWRGRPDFATWTRPKAPSRPAHPETLVARGCPFDCGLCPDHRQQSCCVLLEVTLRCDLACPVCFASAGGHSADPGLDQLGDRLRLLMDRAGPVNLQLSGGEPCVRDDLPEVANLARDVGFGFVQVNSNGLRLGREPDFARRLRDAGVATVFLQFDGTRDEIHERLRGRALLERKLAAIESCGAAGIGVVLVPVVVPGANDDNLGDIVRLAVSLQPVVRGVHFQPVAYFGRYPTPPTDADRITLPEIIAGLEEQTAGQVRVEHFQPAGAENALCSFNGTFVSMPDGRLHALTHWRPEAGAPAGGSGCCGSARPTTPAEGCAERSSEVQRSPEVERARDFVARSWAAPVPRVPTGGPSLGDWDVFLARARTHALCISGMAFQDAWTLDLERLRDCHIHVADLDGGMYPFCAYNLTRRDGSSLYRRAATAAGATAAATAPAAAR